MRLPDVGVRAWRSAPGFADTCGPARSTSCIASVGKREVRHDGGPAYERGRSRRHGRRLPRALSVSIRLAAPG